MELKDIIALPLIMVLICVGIVATSLSQRLRDLAFFFMLTGAAVSERLDVNFFSHYWYRGTTRGLEFSLIDILAICLVVSSLVAPRYDSKRWFWPAGLAVMLLYAAYAAFSVAISDPKIFGLFELSKIIRGIVIFVAGALYIRGRRELGLLAFALCCVVCFEGALAIKQRYFDGLYRVAGSVDHPNSLSMYLCLVSPVLVAAANSDVSRWLRWLCYGSIAIAGGTIILTVSRAGVPIFALVTIGAALFCMDWRITLGKIAVVSVVLLGVGAVGYAAWDTLKTRYLSSTLEEEYLDPSNEGRGVYLRWAGLIVNDRFFGVGLNNWSYWVSKKYGPDTGFPYEDYDQMGGAPEKSLLYIYRYAAPAHNLAALTAGELGVPGLLLFALMWLRWFHMGAVCLWRRLSDPIYRWGVGFFFGTCGVFLQSLTEWTYRQTTIFFTLQLILGGLASLYYLRQRAAQTAPNYISVETDLVELPPNGALVGRF